MLSINTLTVLCWFQSLDMLKKKVTKVKALPEIPVSSRFDLVTFKDNLPPTEGNEVTGVWGDVV